jgi:UDP-N-acetylmuramoyl-tripeptide--D-alanyl-D-alanine ligase
MFTFRDMQAIDHVSVKNMDGLDQNRIKRVTTHSRMTKKGDVFVALRGERFDGNQFVAEAIERGAVCAVVDKTMRIFPTGFPTLVVRDTTKALGDLARLHRRKFTIPVIAITGSSGKTTTKEMIHKVLKSKYHVLCTEGNLNNHIGVPRTLFRLTKNHDLAVIEMGMNHAGEIQSLCSIAEPTHGVITNIGKAHLQFFRSINRIARAKGELFIWLGSSANRKGFVNLDDDLVVMQARTLKKKITFSEKDKKAQVQAKLIAVNKNGCPRFLLSARGWKNPVEIQLSIAGVHNVSNALAAAAIGNEFGISADEIKHGLEHFQPISGRMEVLHAHKLTILNDAYNANPESVLSALRTIASMDCLGRRIVVLGDMLELGKRAIEEHRKVGVELSKHRCDVLFTYGSLANCIHEVSGVPEKYHFARKEELITAIKNIVRKNDVVLVKGSHGMKMKEVVDALVDLRIKQTGAGR